MNVVDSPERNAAELLLEHRIDRAIALLDLDCFYCVSLTTSMPIFISHTRWFSTPTASRTEALWYQSGCSSSGSTMELSHCSQLRRSKAWNPVPDLQWNYWRSSKDMSGCRNEWFAASLSKFKIVGRLFWFIVTRSMKIVDDVLTRRIKFPKASATGRFG